MPSRHHSESEILSRHYLKVATIRLALAFTAAHNDIATRILRAFAIQQTRTSLIIKPEALDLSKGAPSLSLFLFLSEKQAHNSYLRFDLHNPSDSLDPYILVYQTQCKSETRTLQDSEARHPIPQHRTGISLNERNCAVWHPRGPPEAPAISLIIILGIISLD